MNFASERIVTARREHRCYECGRTIGLGETYQRAAGSCWGEFWHAKTCAHCANTRTHVVAYFPAYNEDYYGGLGEHLVECAWDEPRLLRLAVNFRRRWRRRDGGLTDIPPAYEEA